MYAHKIASIFLVFAITRTFQCTLCIIAKHDGSLITHNFHIALTMLLCNTNTQYASFYHHFQSFQSLFGSILIDYKTLELNNFVFETFCMLPFLVFVSSNKVSCLNSCYYVSDFREGLETCKCANIVRTLTAWGVFTFGVLAGNG